MQLAPLLYLEKMDLLKKKYRKFNISKTNVNPGDDYGMLKEVLSRRFTKIKSNNEIESPDLIVIDGGKGHYNVARKVLDELGHFRIKKTRGQSPGFWVISYQNGADEKTSAEFEGANR